MAAGALFSDETGRVLLLQPSYKEHREIPGGYVGHGESPRQACIREVNEELGITPPIGDLLVIDWAPGYELDANGSDKVLYVFDGGVLADHQCAKIHLQRAEIRSFDFYSTAVFDTLLIPRLAKRLTMALKARECGRAIYLEHGVEPAE
jgi:8-oxo-dGTP pyrophosphatase MutT (NUDIX family)